MKKERLSLSRLELMKCKRLYVQQEMKPVGICKELGLDKEYATNITQLIYDRKWSKLRRSRDDQLLNNSDIALSSDENEELEKVASWKDQSEELLEKSFEHGRSAVDTKDLMQASMAAKNFLGLYRSSSALNPIAGQSGMPTGLNILIVQPIIEKAVRMPQAVDIPEDTEDPGL